MASAPAEILEVTLGTFVEAVAVAALKDSPPEARSTRYTNLCAEDELDNDPTLRKLLVDS